MNGNDNRGDSSADEQFFGKEQEKPAPVPILVTRGTVNGPAKENAPDEARSNVIDLDTYRSAPNTQSVEEALVQEWNLNPGGTGPLVKLIMVSSGFGSVKRSSARSSDIQCLAA
ncbi:hypothetical protein SK3146_02915 [Paenibacillus konkukensis]|uniref:Uncharacterized protein n=1 Tax=Paenibacillus konkukensis TaxID=2020716 RepID=A0ABY4RNI1_9BACL|nr:hypothetical protein [Paenibacillus konkukensis]UQZ83708.1 hypothetical protein SK3146_02915 [Paenibacillus konkukensis]